MNAEREQLLGTLELLVSNTFVWKTEIQGKFNLWNLMISEGFVNLTDVELVFKHWQKIEEWGTPTDQTKNDYEYAPLRSERDDKDWNQEIATERKNFYQQIQQFITTQLQNIQAYKLCVPKCNSNTFEWEHPDFSIFIVVGETQDNQWLCLAPTVPDQVSYHKRKRDRNETKTVTKLQEILDKITPITIFGYYYGGYNYTYQHQIVSGIAQTKAEAIEITLKSAEMVSQKKKIDEYTNDGYNSQKLSQFMNQCLRDRTEYNISFWDIGYIYKIGQTPSGDWIGVRYQNEFEYNP
jgi:hypothetical protein